MEMTANPAKLLRMTWPLYALMALGVLVNPGAWLPLTLARAAILALPLALPLLGVLAGRRWRLEVTPEALLHHTLARTERFAWERMGPVEVRWLRIGHLPVARTLWFAYPVEASRSPAERVAARLGRRLLPVFVDLPLARTAEEIEAWRALTHPAVIAARGRVQASAPPPTP